MVQSGGTGQKAIDAAGNVGSGAAASVLTWLVTSLGISLDPALAKLLAAGGFVVGVAFALTLRRYAVIITRRGPHERTAYDALRRSLIEGGAPARIYSERLRKVLDAVDSFFGDAGGADRTLWPRAFGLRTSAPLWTAPAFDRCLLLALLYPIGVIMFAWLLSGHQGPAERSIGLPPSTSGAERGAATLPLIVAAFCGWRAARGSTWSRVKWSLSIVAIMIATLILAFVIGGVNPAIEAGGLLGTVVLALAAAVAVGGAGSGAVIGPVASGVSLIFINVLLRPTFVAIVTILPSHAPAVHEFEIDSVVAMTFTAWIVLAIAAGIAAAVVVVSLDKMAARRQCRGLFQALYLFSLMFICFLSAQFLSNFWYWQFTRPLLLFLGLLTLANAPFDWASLGLTRALLRRGLELGAWWPYFLALADAVCAAVIITVLTVWAVISVQLFDDLAAHMAGESARALPLRGLFDGIERHPGAPEYWWVYAMLLSTMIPSIVNMTISGASLLRGVPWITDLLLWLMPERGAPPSFNRPWITLLLTLQLFVGAAIGIVAQGLLVYLVIWWLLPPFGVDLLGLARAVAAPDLPGQVIAAVAGLF